LGRLHKEFQASGTEVVIILGESLEQARSYAEILHLPFPVLSDPERAVYHSYGLGMRFFLQRTAALIVDKEGVIRYLKLATNPMVWLQESRELLKAAQVLAG
jgi:peroxiredoxin